MTDQAELDGIYGQRFGVTTHVSRASTWAEIAAFLQRWIPRDGRILDLGCDAGHFIAQVEAAERWATDVRDVAARLDPSVRFVQANGLDLASAVPNGYFDVVFASNYLEHLASADEVLVQLRQARRVLRPGGRLIVLQPNIRLVGAAYWDFIDHHVPLTERSLVEAAVNTGFEVEHLITRFLPYTSKSWLPTWRWLVRWYLRLPIAWRLFGKQTLLVARATNRG